MQSLNFFCYSIYRRKNYLPIEKTALSMSHFEKVDRSLKIIPTIYFIVLFDFSKAHLSSFIEVMSSVTFAKLVPFIYC